MQRSFVADLERHMALRSGVTTPTAARRFEAPQHEPGREQNEKKKRSFSEFDPWLFFLSPRLIPIAAETGGGGGGGRRSTPRVRKAAAA
ncbi:uncharacterized protein V6R79_026086 [Siganus canaliculatus]